MCGGGGDGERGDGGNNEPGVDSGWRIGEQCCAGEHGRDRGRERDGGRGDEWGREVGWIGEISGRRDRRGGDSVGIGEQCVVSVGSIGIRSGEGGGGSIG